MKIEEPSITKIWINIAIRTFHLISLETEITTIENY